MTSASVLVWVPLGLVAAGAVAFVLGLRAPGAVGVLAGVSWAGPQLVSFSPGWYPVGLVTGPLWVLAASALGLAALPDVWSSSARRVVLVACSAGAVAGWLRAVSYQPFDDPDCHRWCAQNTLLVRSSLGLAQNLTVIAGVAGAVASATLLATVVRALHAAAPAARPVAAAVSVLAASVLAEEVSWVALAGTFVPEVPDALTRALHDVAGVAAAAVMVVLIVERAGLVSRLNGVVSTLAPDIEGGVAALLTSALRDPEVRLGHLVQDVGFVDLAGQELGPVEPGRRRTELADGAAVVAVIDHRRDVPPGLLAGRLGPTLRTAIQNEGLEMRLRREVAALAESRRRIVEHADAERSRLERDLHDGAQHRLLALAIELSRLRRRLTGTTPGEPHALDGAVDSAASATDELLRRLREVARGIHPAVLDGGGLVPALHQLADTAPAPFLLTVGDVGELPAATARTAYALARDATSHPIEEMTLKYDPDDRRLVLTVESPAPAPQPAHDRAAAANASIIATPTGWEVRLPCVSSSLTTPS